MVLVKTEMEIPETFTLSQNYPNPFNPETTIHFTIPHPSHVRVAIYNITGGLVKTLVNNIADAGYHSVNWDGTDERNQRVGSGVYFYRMETDNLRKTKKMLLLK